MRSGNGVLSTEFLILGDEQWRFVASEALPVVPSLSMIGLLFGV